MSMVSNFGGDWIEKRGERSAGYKFTENQTLRKPHELIIALVITISKINTVFA